MGKLTITETPISGLYVVETDAFLDHRGAFARWFCEGEMKEILGNRHIKNVNFSRTVKKGVDIPRNGCYNSFCSGMEA